MMTRWFRRALTENREFSRSNPVEFEANTESTACFEELSRLLDSVPGADSSGTPEISHRVLSLLEELTLNEHALVKDEQVYAAAIAETRRAITLWPDQGAFHVILGGLLITRGSFAEGLKRLDGAVPLLPKSTPAYIGLMSVTPAMEKEIEAEIAAARIARDGQLQGTPFSREHAIVAYGVWRKNLATAHPAVSDRMLAMIQFHRFRLCEDGTGLLPALVPTSSADYIARGQLFVRLAPARAINDFAHALDVEPANAEALVGRALCHLESGDSRAAIADLSICTQHHPLDVKANILFARVLNENDLKDAAIDGLNRLIHGLESGPCLNPKDLALAYSYRGSSYQGIGEHELAIIDFGMALELDPTLGECFRLRGISLRETGRTQDALRDLATAIARDENDAAARVSRALLHEATGDNERAIRDYHAALAIDEYAGNAHAMAKARERLKKLEHL